MVLNHKITVGLFLLFAHCTHRLSSDEIIGGLIYHINKESNLSISPGYEDVLSYSRLIQNEHYNVRFHLKYPHTQIQNMANNFFHLRRNSTGPGYGKFPSGWEYYSEYDGKLKVIIDTVTDQVKVEHEYYFGL